MLSNKIEDYQRTCVEHERVHREGGFGWRIIGFVPHLRSRTAFLQLHFRQFRGTLARLRDAIRPRGWEYGTRANFLLPVTQKATEIEPRILIDVTYSASQPTATGIQRVVREMAKGAYETGVARPIIIEKSKIYPAYRETKPIVRMALADGDTLFLLDASFFEIDNTKRLIAQVKGKQGRVVLLIYDVIPMLYPALCARDYVCSFSRWFDDVFTRADAILTISNAAAQEIRKLAAARLPRGAEIPICVIPLGCNLCPAADGTAMTHTLEACRSGPFFLSVGTIEPRKGHPIALDAFEALWAKGSRARFVVLGRTGWGMSHFERRMIDHPEYGKRLVWLDDADEADLAYAYAHARAVILASVSEGFGMPIIEAAAFGTEVILSDIPVFREVGRYARTRFFPAADMQALATTIEQALAGSDGAQGLDRVRDPIPTWSEVVATATAMIRSPALYEAKGRILSAGDFGLGG